MKEFHVKEPLYIFFYNIKEMFEFCKPEKLSRFTKKMLLFNHCWFIRILVIVARCQRKWWEDFTTSSNELHVFHRFAGLQSKVFFWKLTVEQYFKSLANKSNSQVPIFLHFLQYDPKEVRVLTNLIFLVLG